MYRRRPIAVTTFALSLVAASAGALPSLAGTDPAQQGEPQPSPTPDAAPAIGIDDLLSPLDPGPGPTGVAGKLANWITASNDNAGLPFMIIDKQAADVFAFNAIGLLLGRAPVLVGLAPGDDSAPGVGDLKLAAIKPDQRTTPAGRFVAKFGGSDGHGTVLWVDYADAISMHPVITTNPAEHRLKRIKSTSPADHRISFGCINVPAAFYNYVVVKAFKGGGVIYILPDSKPLAQVFPAFAASAGLGGDAQAGTKSDPCADPELDVPNSVPDPALTPVCPVSDALTKVAAKP
jgi:hypothetical protein